MTRELTDTEALVARLAGKAEEAMGIHPELESLLAYHSGTLPPETEQSVKNHLVGCRDCTESLLDLGSFWEAGREPAGNVADLTAVAAWRDFRARLTEEGKKDRGRQTWRALYPLAASLLLGVVALSFWVAGLRTSNAELRQSVAELSAVQVNPPTYYLEEVTRGNEKGIEVELPPQLQFYQVIAVPVSTAPFSAFETEISDAAGQVIWHVESGRSEAETLRFVFHRTQFPPGEYRMRVYGLDGGRRELVDDKRLSLRNP